MKLGKNKCSLLMSKTINNLPQKYKWTIHNIIAHPLMELAHLLGNPQLSEFIHDSTIPNNINGKANTERDT